MTEKSQQDDIERRAEEWAKKCVHTRGNPHWHDLRDAWLAGARAEREQMTQSPDGVLALAIEQDLGVYSYGGLGPIHREAITERNTRIQELVAENARLTERLRMEEQAHREMRPDVVYDNQVTRILELDEENDLLRAALEEV
jgi:hypothetical protein